MLTCDICHKQRASVIEIVVDVSKFLSLNVSLARDLKWENKKYA